MKNKQNVIFSIKLLNTRIYRFERPSTAIDLLEFTNRIYFNWARNRIYREQDLTRPYIEPYDVVDILGQKAYCE